jgi:hypothetical protein
MIIRDPRDWVVSNMNWGTMYGNRDWISRLGLGRLNPKMIGDTQFEDNWPNFSRFQKLCWAWKTIYEIILHAADKDPNAIIFKFEDLFRSEKKYENLEKLLSFITQFPGKKFNFRIPEDIFFKKINKNISCEFAKWETWDEKMTDEITEICGKTAAKFNYSLNISPNKS